MKSPLMTWKMPDFLGHPNQTWEKLPDLDQPGPMTRLLDLWNHGQLAMKNHWNHHTWNICCIYIYIEKNIYIYICIYIIDHIHKYRKKQHTHLTIKLKIIAYYSDLIGKMMIKHWLTIGFRGRLFSSPPPVASSWRAPCAPEPERLGQARRKVWSRAEENREKMGRIGVHIWFAQIKIIIIIIMGFSSIVMV